MLFVFMQHLERYQQVFGAKGANRHIHVDYVATNRWEIPGHRKVLMLSTSSVLSFPLMCS